MTLNGHIENCLRSINSSSLNKLTDVSEQTSKSQ